MNDDMDYYVGRCLKNWAAASQPPKSARARLLKAAGSPPVQGERQIMRIMTAIWSMFFGPDWVYPDADNLNGLQMQARPWFLHIDTYMRLAFF